MLQDEEPTDVSLPKGSVGWCTRFLKRYKLVYRAVTNKNPLPKQVQIDKLRQAHLRLRDFIRASGPGPMGKFIAFLRYRFCYIFSRYNLDEVGLEIFPDRQKTIVKKGSVRIRLSMGGTGKARR